MLTVIKLIQSLFKWNETIGHNIVPTAPPMQENKLTKKTDSLRRGSPCPFEQAILMRN